MMGAPTMKRIPAFRFLLVPAVLLAAAAGCATTQEAADPAGEVAGCYQFTRNDGARELGLPWGFELLDAPLQGWGNLPDAHAARTRVTEREVRDHPFAYWRWTEADSVQVGHPGGGGFSLTLGPEGQDLVGSARAVGDIVLPGESSEPREARRVVARKVLCPPAALGGGGRP